MSMLSRKPAFQASESSAVRSSLAMVVLSGEGSIPASTKGAGRKPRKAALPGTERMVALQQVDSLSLPSAKTVAVTRSLKSNTSLPRTPQDSLPSTSSPVVMLLMCPSSRSLTNALSLKPAESLNGPPAVSATLNSSSVVYPPRNRKSNSSPGAWVTTFTTPAEAFLPNRVLCGPRSTSMRSMSSRSLKAWDDRTKGTSSTTMATLGSMLMLNTLVPMPRRLKPLLVAQSPRLTVNDGDMRVMSVNSSMRMASMVDSSTALTATGTSCTLCARFVAVTTISSR